MNMNKLLKSSIEITGKIPLLLKNKLESAGVLVDGLITGGNNINVTLNSKGVETTVEATFVGNGKWVVDSLDDAANLFPEIEEGDSVSADMFTKLFMNSINSGLILSFNPLGEVKYGIKDKIDNLKEKAQKVKDWANNTLYAEDAEKWIRGNGPYRRTFTDARDGQTRTKKDYSAGRINVGKIQQLNDEGKGHYKVLTGNPATQDFQVWHLYKNGNKIRCLDLKTGLKAQEAQWVYDNNIPDSWSEADWNPEGEIPEKASKIEIGETQEQKNQTEESQNDETTEEDNVTETEESQETNETENEEDNVTEIDDMDPDTWFDEDNTHETVTEEEDNVVEEPKNTDAMGNDLSKLKKYKKVASLYKDIPAFEDITEEQLDDYLSKLETVGSKKKKKVAASLVKSSIEDSDSDFGGDIEEDNVIESEPKKKSKYNGCNVTGCTEGDGSVVMASLEEDNVIDSEEITSSLLITEDLKQFIDYTNTLKNVNKGVVDKWKEIKGLLLDIATLDKETLKNMTRQSGDNLIIDFNETGTGQNYAIVIELTPNSVNVTDKVAPGHEYEHLIQSLKTVKEKLEPKF